MPAARREQILDAALAVFARHGYHKATIKQIAREAGLKSPALIYWYFPNKSELFRAVVQRLATLFTRLTDYAHLLDLPPGEVLTRLAREYLAIFDNPRAENLFRTLVADALRAPERSTEMVEQSLGEVVRFLAAYFQRQVDLGRLRAHNPEASARAFLGALNAFVMSRTFFPPLHAGFPDRDTYADHIVSIFLDGLRAEEPPCSDDC